MLALGSGGENRFGQLRHVSRKRIHRLVRRALDLGINFFDTAGAYGQSESMLGEALKGVPRDSWYVATKLLPRGTSGVIGAAAARSLVERSLRRLGVEALDIIQLHRVSADAYAETRDRLVPELQKLRAEGKVRYIGITESSRFDADHRMLTLALQDDLFDSVMVAYHLANRSAENVVFPLAREKDVGVIAMTVARHQVYRNTGERLKLCCRVAASLVTSPPGPDRLMERLSAGASALFRPGPRQALPVARAGGGKPLQLPAAAYTFAASQPAIATVLTGTTNLGHLEQNLEAVLAPALTEEEIEKLRAFGV